MIYDTIGQAFPERFRQRWKTLLLHAGVRADAGMALGFLVVAAIVLGGLVAYDLQIFYGIPAPAGFVAGALVVVLLTLYMLTIQAERRSRAIEAVLPDAILLMSGNLKAGVTVDRALLLGGEQKLGLLREELARVGREVGAGADIKGSLLALSSRFRSQKLHKTVLLMNAAIQGGGKLAVLLEQIARNLRNQETVEKKTRSTIITYVMFIGLALALVAPFLFAVSVFLVTTLQGASSGLSVPEGAAGAPLFVITPVVSERFLVNFSILTLITSAFMGSLLIGQLMKGKALWGVRYAPATAIVAIVVFQGVRFTIDAVLTGLLG